MADVQELLAEVPADDGDLEVADLLLDLIQELEPEENEIGPLPRRQRQMDPVEVGRFFSI